MMTASLTDFFPVAAGPVAAGPAPAVPTMSNGYDSNAHWNAFTEATSSDGLRGRYADILRAIGDFLDCQFATRASIGVADDAVLIQWCSPSGAVERRRYLQDDLTMLARQARWQRGSVQTARILRARRGADGSWEHNESRGELLRTLGQNLDRDDILVEGIIETSDGYQIFGTVDGADVDRYCPIAELWATGKERREQRRAA